ncbi:MAG: YncE family protein [Acidimicrobiia bacterium]
MSATIGVGINVGDIVLSPDESTLYALLFGEGRVRQIDTATNTLMPGSIVVGDSPAGAAISPDGTKLYVTNAGSASLSVIELATGTVTSTITVGKGPLSVAFAGSACPVLPPAPAPVNLAPAFTG